MLPYERFYQGALKPLFHNFKSLYEDYTKIESADSWRAYQHLNQLFG